MPPLSFLLGRALLCAALCGVASGAARAQTGVFPEDVEVPLMLDELVVEESGPDSADYDPTGLGGSDAERYEPPFANDLMADIGMEEMDFSDLDGELAALVLARGDAAEIAVSGERLDLRGFPTPQRRNGFALAGIPEVLNPDRTETISASLVPVVGRAAPGGIKNTTTARPRGRVTRGADVSVSTDGRTRASLRGTGVVTPKKAWYHAAATVSDSRGPQRYSKLRQTGVAAALAVRHSRVTSTLWQLDVVDVNGNPAPGVPQYRATPGGKILGPYRPLAEFHTYGPNAGVDRRAVSLGWQLETAIRPDLALSSGTNLYAREAAQDRFTTGQYVLSTGKFSGVREPTRREEDYLGLAHQTDLTRRFDACGAAHKLRFGVEGTLAGAQDENRGILASERNLYLPPDVQSFDPFAPNYYRPPYSEQVYRRVITDQEVRLTYGAAAADLRSAFAGGRTVFTAGLRNDLSRVEVSDRRAGAAVPEASRTNDAISYHVGVNQRVGRRVLLFANASSAVEPSTRVDARTGAIQENESTRGHEVGARTMWLERTLSVSMIAHDYTNSDIARRNPLYNDPVADPNQTQPQLVSSGEEEFRGLTVQTGWKPVPEWTFTGRATWQDATTVSSPDLPEEEGRPLAGVPRFSASLGVNYQASTGRLRGFSAGGGVTHIGEVVQTYERADRVQVEYPDYRVVSLRAAYTWKAGAVTHTASISVANALDTDLLAKVARVGAERSLTAGWRVAW